MLSWSRLFVCGDIRVSSEANGYKCTFLEVRLLKEPTYVCCCLQEPRDPFIWDISAVLREWRDFE
jgi:hypothetical protein